MRKAFLLFLVAMLVLLLVGIAAAVGFASADALHGATITIDGEPFSGSALAGTVGWSAAIGVVFVGLLVVGVLASVAVVVPIVLVAVIAIVLFSLVVGLAPILVPVLLLVGAYVLLSRWTKRRSVPEGRAQSPSSSSSSSPTVS